LKDKYVFCDTILPGRLRISFACSEFRDWHSGPGAFESCQMTMNHHPSRTLEHVLSNHAASRAVRYAGFDMLPSETQADLLRLETGDTFHRGMEL